MIRTTIAPLAALFALAAGAPQALAATIFSDTFASSSLNSAAPAAPTATSTDYAVVSSKNATSSSIAAGDLKVRIAATSSGLNEAQARFAASPVVLTNVGDFIELSVTFIPTGILYTANNTSASLGLGLYNSHGTTPVTGGAMSNSLLGTADVTYATGFAAGWEGFATKLRLAAGELFTRPAQTDTTNESQDLVFHDGVTGGFDMPNGSSLPGSATGLMLVNGTVYTYTLRVTMAAGGLLDAAQNMYAGAGTGGANLYSHSSTTTFAQTITTQFDAMAIGYRGTNDTVNTVAEHTLDISQIQVVTGSVPEPATSCLGLVVAFAVLGGLRRRK